MMTKFSLLALVLCIFITACNETSKVVEDVGIKNDQASKDQGQKTDGTLPDSQRPDMSPDLNANDMIVKDGTTTVQYGYLLWHAPGGFAGWGPGLEITIQKKIRFWKNAKVLTPQQTKDWDYEGQLNDKEYKGIFDKLAKVDFSKLPHKSNPQECYPSFYYEPDNKKIIKFNYYRASDLLPEMKEVYDMFDALVKTLSSVQATSPSDYCNW